MSNTKKRQNTILHVADKKYIPIDFEAFDILINHGATVFFIYCAMCRKCFSDKKRLYAQQKVYGGNYSLNDSVITFSQKDIHSLGITPKTARRAIDKLVSIGAIKIIEQNQHRKIMNVYRVNRWDKWDIYSKEANKAPPDS